MNINLKAGCFFVALCALIHTNSADFESARAIQILTPVNHSFQFELNDFKSILEAEEIKDRYVVVVSTAGAFRTGKSSLMNYHLRYLYARYKHHNITDWIGESSSNELRGFKWRGGRKPETTGIYMWSDIFTYDYENGQKIAIILLDTQGIFDSRSSMKENTAIFALSTLLSSVQCYNVMHNIQEDDLQHLEMFTEYARLALEETNEKAFQYLLFIVRDWPFAYEIDYGWQGDQVISELLSGDSQLTPEMLQLRQRINSSFVEIGAFVMPHPGFAVAQARNFNGNLKQIHPDFVRLVKELVPGIFAPENLVVKKINGKPLRARDMAYFVQKYVDVFNGNTLPEARSVLIVTAEASNHILYKDCLQSYSNAVQMFIDNSEPYAMDNDLTQKHLEAKNFAIEEFVKTPKLGGNEIASAFQRKLEDGAEEQFRTFVEQNNVKREANNNQMMADTSYLVQTIQTRYKNAALSAIAQSKSYLSDPELVTLVRRTKQGALAEFDEKKAGDNEITEDFREVLVQYLDSTLVSVLVESNSAKKTDHFKKMAIRAGGAGLAGAAVCALFFGPVGIAACGLGAGIAGGVSSNYNIGSYLPF